MAKTNLEAGLEKLIAEETGRRVAAMRRELQEKQEKLEADARRRADYVRGLEGRSLGR